MVGSRDIKSNVAYAWWRQKSNRVDVLQPHAQVGREMFFRTLDFSLRLNDIITSLFKERTLVKFILLFSSIGFSW